MNRKRSDIWKFFTVVNENSAKCTFCSGTFSYKGGATANLTRHLKRKHPTSLVAIGPSTSATSMTGDSTSANDEIKDTDAESTPHSTTATKMTANDMTDNDNKIEDIPNPKRKCQSTLSNFMRRPLPLQSSKKLDEQLTIMIAAEYQPFSLVEDKQFRIFVNLLNPNYSLPSRKTVSNVFLPQLYAKIREAVEERLSTADYVAFTTDGWTSLNNESYQSLTAHFIDLNGKLECFVLGCYKTDEAHTAVNLATLIKILLSEWQILEKICGVVTDNAANIKAAIRNISSTWCHSGCFAHSLNLVLQTGLQEINMA